MDKKKITIILLLAAILIFSYVLRSVGLKDQGLIFFDESAMVARADMFVAHVEGRMPTSLMPFLYVDSKLLWLFLIMLAKLYIFNAVFTANYISCAFGVLTVFLTYLFAKKLYRSESIGIFSALFLALSSQHIFYSRLAMPESASAFFVLLSIYIYLFILEERKGLILFSALSGSAAFLLTRFRVILLPVFILLLEVRKKVFLPEADKKNWVRPVFFALCFATGIFAGADLIRHVLIFFFNIETVPFLAAIKQHLSAHMKTNFEWLAPFSFFYFMYSFEGAVFYIIFLIGIVTLTHKKSSLLPVAFILLQVLAASIVNERVPRSMSPILPFVAMVCGAGMYNLFELSSQNFIRRICVYIILISFLGSAFFNARKTLSYSNESRRLVQILNVVDKDAGVISTNIFNTLLYSKKKKVAFMKQKSLRYLIHLNKNKGYKYLLLDHEKYRCATYNGSWNHIQLNEAASVVERLCKPVYEVYSCNLDLQEKMAFEHNRNLISTLRFIKYLNDDTGKARLYNLDECFKNISEK